MCSWMCTGIRPLFSDPVTYQITKLYLASTVALARGHQLFPNLVRSSFEITGGGVLLYIHDSLQSVSCTPLNDLNID